MRTIKMNMTFVDNGLITEVVSQDVGGTDMPQTYVKVHVKVEDALEWTQNIVRRLALQEDEVSVLMPEAIA